jgi:hypothetical protein
LAGLGLWLLSLQSGFAHCDTMDGPVVVAAKAALEKREVTPALKWVKKQDEAEIKAAFEKTLAVRAKGTEARDLADRWFFETLVRVHRAGEGAPFTGLKPAGRELGPAIEGADKALESGSVDTVVKLLTHEVTEGLHKRFAEAREKKEHAEHNVEAGREYVAACVDYVHHVEGLHEAAQGAGGHHEEVPAKAEHKEHAPAHKH